MASVAKKLFKGSILRSITLVSNIVVGFFMMPFLVHSLGDEQYGIWVLVGAVVGFYGLLDAGFGHAIVRFIVRALHSEDDEDVNVALSSSVFLFSLIGLLSLVITLVIVLSIPYFVDSAVNKSLAQLLVGILGVKVSILFPLSSFSGVLMAKYRFDILSYIGLLSLVFRTALIVLFVSNGYDIVTVVIITALDALVVSLSTIYFAKKLFPKLKISISLISIERLRKFYNYGKYVYVINIADKIRYSIDDLVVGAFIGVGAVTHYTVAIVLIRYFGELMGAVFGVINPVLNKYHKLKQWDKLRDMFLVATELSAMTSVLIGGLLIVLGEPFIHLWMGREYGDAYIALVILCVASIVANAQRPSVAILFVIAKHKYYAKITSVEAVANIGISIVLVQYLGIYGVALGTTVPSLFNKLLLQPLYACKQLNVSPKHYYCNLSKYFISGMCIFLPLYFIVTSVQIDSYIKLVAVSSVTAVLYVLICTRYLFSDTTIDYISDLVPDKARFLLNKATKKTISES